MVFPHCPKTLARTAQLEIHWTGPTPTKATNILHAMGATNPHLAALQEAAAFLYAGVTAGGGIYSLCGNGWKLDHIQAIDNSGTTELTASDGHSPLATVGGGSAP